MRDQGYRTRDEVEEWRLRDPIKRLREYVVDNCAEAAVGLDAIDAEVNTQVDAALEWAKASPWPNPATVLDHVYA
jgi:TPP-dependent pyruvate/acetoin dehydrogenase alpha subunit